MARNVKNLHQDDAAIAQAEAPHLRRVNWKKEPGLRRLYMWAFVLWIASWTTGYDGYTHSAPFLADDSLLIRLIVVPC